MEFRTVFHRAAAGARQVDRGKDNRRQLDDGADLPPVMAPDADRSASKNESGESEFASVTAGLVLRRRVEQLMQHASPPAHASRTDHKSDVLEATAGLLASKGEAKPSTIAGQPREVAHDAVDGGIHTLREELVALRSALSDREAALAKTALEHEQLRERQQQELKAAEAALLSKAETEWQERSARALAEVRADAECARGKAESDVRSLREELAALRSSLADREAALAKAVSDTERVRERGKQELGAALATAKLNQAGEAINRDADTGAIRSPAREDGRIGTGIRSIPMMPERESSGPKRPGALRNIAVAATLAILAIAAYPWMAPFLPPSWQSNIAAITGGFGSAHRSSVASPVSKPVTSSNATTSSAATKASNAAAQSLAVVIREANLRVGPSTTDKIIALLPRDMKVTPIERRGDWTLVQIDGSTGKASARRGWVYTSYLKEGSATPTRDRQDNRKSTVAQGKS
ncbi:MAG TPA: SH3 domain-containing protein [Micropepsaceae bacterium]|nr:SH3 domain-containing protein [Micropepsaceae bacterium]